MACTIDFRRLDEGFGGKTAKRKRQQQAEEHDVENDDAPLAMEIDDDEGQTSAKRQAVASTTDPNKPKALGVATYDGCIAGRVSGRNWKQPRKHRSSAMKVSQKGTPYEIRAKEKEVKKAYRERVKELKEEIRLNKVDKRKRKEEAEKRKQENILRSGTKLQRISNPKTLKKIAKSKDRKQLRVVPDELLAGGKKKMK